MATVGAVGCTMVRGDCPGLAERSRLWQVPGHNGYGIQLLGTGNGRFGLVCIYYSTAADVAAWHANLQALQGTIVSIVNDYGTTYTYCFIHRVGPLLRTVAGATGCRGECQVSGVRTE